MHSFSVCHNPSTTFHYARTLWIIACGRGSHAKLLQRARRFTLSENIRGIVTFTVGFAFTSIDTNEINMLYYNRCVLGAEYNVEFQRSASTVQERWLG